MLRSRRKAREAALQALFGCDLLEQWDSSLVDLYFQLNHVVADGHDEKHATADKEHYEFSRKLIDGVIENRVKLDEKIALVSKNWTIGRMSRIDRNILRIAVFELSFLADVPVSVSLNEAIEIAKEYGGDDSPTFVNGLLDQLAKRIRPGEDPHGPSRLVANAKAVQAQ